MAPNTEILIQIVQKYPVLYDTSHRDYKNIRIKNETWDNIAEILGECHGDTIKNNGRTEEMVYSKHLRSCKTRTGQAAKLTERYKTWPWATIMCFLRPHLEFAETHSNVQRNTEETGSFQSNTQKNAEELGSSQSTNPSTPINTAQSQPNDLSQPQQDDTPQHVHSRRKRTSEQSQSQVDKVINFISNNTEKDDDTDLLFKSYAKKLKKITNRRQATVEFEIAKMLKAELEEANEMQARSDAEQYQENSMVMIIQPPASSAGSDTTDSVYIVSSASLVFENVNPSNTPLLPPSYMQPSQNLPINTQASHNRPSNNLTFQEDRRSNFIDPSQCVLRLINK